MPASGGRVKEVKEGSIAAAVGIEPGDLVLSANSHPLRDLLDYRYQCAGEEMTLEVLKPDRETWLVEVEKDYGEDLGLTFEDVSFDGLIKCRNHCLFCFVDQMPRGLRRGLYVRDDDYRHSFLYGSYLTLTNLRPGDLQRIKEMRLSPLYISVHATDPELRARMLRNRNAGQILALMRDLAAAGIVMHTQVVLCRGLNDGPNLERTLRDLSGLWPSVETVAVVPVGLTSWREGLYPVEGFTPAGALEVVRQVEALQEEFLSKQGDPLVYPADEFYLLAGLPVPRASRYSGFSQLENGVGLVRRFLDGLEELKKDLPAHISPRRVAVATGLSAGRLLRGAAEEVAAMVEGLSVHVFPLPNHFFGPLVTVAGLLTGGDLAGALPQLLQESGAWELLLPDVMLQKGGGIFLDGLTLEELSARLGLPVRVAEASARGFLGGLLGF